MNLQQIPTNGLVFVLSFGAFLTEEKPMKAKTNGVVSVFLFLSEQKKTFCKTQQQQQHQHQQWLSFEEREIERGNPASSISG